MTGAGRPAAMVSTGWALCLYINGASMNSIAAIDNVRRICDDDLAGRVTLEVIDVRKEPARVAADDVTAAPTLIKRRPLPRRVLVGDLGNADRVRRGLDLSGR